MVVGVGGSCACVNDDGVANNIVKVEPPPLRPDTGVLAPASLLEVEVIDEDCIPPLVFIISGGDDISFTIATNSAVQTTIIKQARIARRAIGT